MAKGLRENIITSLYPGGLSNDCLPHEPGIHPALIKLTCQRGRPASRSADSSLTWGESAQVPTGAGPLPGTWELGRHPGLRSQVDKPTFIVPILLEKSYLVAFAKTQSSRKSRCS